MDPIKDAFQKVKEDMNSLKEELDFIKKELAELKNNSIIKQNSEKNPTHISTESSDRQTDTENIPTQNFTLEALKDQNLSVSSGNKGVPTDRQTNRQTNRQTDFRGDETNYNYIEENFSFDKKREHKEPSKEPSKEPKDHVINNAAEILDSLDSLKKEIRLKFKRLTDQEFLVFSTLYQLDQDLGYSSYKDISERLNLTESSIRDYIGRLINKGIPIEKNKINNKNIQLNISNNLKKIATLPTIIRLRDL